MRFLFVIGLLVMWSKTVGYAETTVKKDDPNGTNVFIITLDGFRWQELFFGADSAILHDPQFTDDTEFMKAMFWDSDLKKRREKLMPFTWNIISEKGQLFGNRTHGNKVNTKNFYSISYPGYNEIFTGQADPLISTNKKSNNKNVNLLEYLNKIPQYQNKIAAFTSWDAFPYILNEERSNIKVNSGHEQVKDKKLTKNQQALNRLQERPENEGVPERNDLLTFVAAKEHIIKHQPKVVHIGLGGTDSYGHQKMYGQYLKEANQADRLIADLWNYVNTSPFYKNNTTFIITTDHGRGDSPKSWYKHGFFVTGSSQAWIAMIGKGVKPIGEHKGKQQLFLKHVAGTIGYLVGVKSFSRQMIPATYFENKDAVTNEIVTTY